MSSPYGPEFRPLLSEPWCASCGEGVLVPLADQRRPVRRHAATCALRRSPVHLVAPRCPVCAQGEGMPHPPTPECDPR